MSIDHSWTIRQKGGLVESLPTNDSPAPIVRAADRTVEVDQRGVHIHDLNTDRPSILEYLRNIAPAKQEIALLHALEVGINELAVRRERFRH